MGCRYQKPSDRESEVSFRVVEIFEVKNGINRTGNKGKFLLVDNRPETLEIVQKGMEDFVRTAILANRLGNFERCKETRKY